MASNISFNPVLTTVAAGTFTVQTDGFMQGVFLDDPAIRNELVQGILATTETLPMWGGIAIYENIPGVSGGPADNLGSVIGRATSNAAIAGFSTFNQASNFITTPQSEAPSAGQSMSVPYFRLGSGARIAVQCDPGLAALEGATTSPQVSWDINNQVLQEYVASGATEAVTSMTWSATNGGQIAVVMTGASVFGLGDQVYVSGATNTGTGGASAVNGRFVINTWTDTTHFTLLAPAASGVIGTIGGTIVLNVGIGALAVKVLSLHLGNSRTILYDPVQNFVHWQNGGNVAIIQL